MEGLKILENIPSGIYVIFGGLLTWLLTSYNQRRERIYIFNKEKYFYTIKKIETIIGGLTQMNINIYKGRAFYNSFTIGVFFEEEILKKAKFEKEIKNNFDKDMFNYTNIYCINLINDLRMLKITYLELISIFKLKNMDKYKEMEDVVEKFNKQYEKLIEKYKNEIIKLEKKIN